MATSQTSSGKKSSTKTAPSIAAKKAPAKKMMAAPAKKTDAPKAASKRPDVLNQGASIKGVAKSSIAPEARYRMIEAAAYFRAESRGFSGGHALEDWVAAEAEIDALLNN